ncbi:helix-turn-helix domain-containing protein [Streptomyces cacaoi]|uniref:helix-turn-helix domain-containing protein n=1 Tax=Streptomyces cacaoi TaxID=1898 RepID=UPI0033201864
MTAPFGKPHGKRSELPCLYTALEVATALRCSEWWVKEQARQRRIPFIKSGGAYRFTRAHVDEIFALLEERPTSGTLAPTPSTRRPSAKAGAPVTRLQARRPSRARRAAA